MLRLGFDVGGTYIKAGVVDTNLIKIVSRRIIPFPSDASYTDVAELVYALSSEMAAELKIQNCRFKSVGLALPGILNEDRSVLKRAYNLGWYDAPVRAAVQNYFSDVPVYLENDANAALIAERHGALRGCKNVVLLTLGTGVGSGVLLNGALLRGESGSSAELGHVRLFPDGPKCSCGNRGCIEALCSATWLTEEGKKSVINSPTSLMYKKTDGDAGKITPKTVFDSAKEGDGYALAIFNKYVDSLAAAVAYCADRFNAGAVAIGGGISMAGFFLFSALKARVKEMHGCRCRILPAMFANDAGIIGAALLYKFQ
ncbi:MAG: ROK family protein [Firmicutes bacterium]|nr:ROK family protein [Bacillota bacterium]